MLHTNDVHMFRSLQTYSTSAYLLQICLPRHIHITTVLSTSGEALQSGKLKRTSISLSSLCFNNFLSHALRAYASQRNFTMQGFLTCELIPCYYSHWLFNENIMSFFKSSISMCMYSSPWILASNVFPSAFSVLGEPPDWPCCHTADPVVPFSRRCRLESGPITEVGEDSTFVDVLGIILNLFEVFPKIRDSRCATETFPTRLFDEGCFFQETKDSTCLPELLVFLPPCYIVQVKI